MLLNICDRAISFPLFFNQMLFVYLFACLLLFLSKQDADMLAGDEQAWKEAKEVINMIGAAKSHEGILGP